MGKRRHDILGLIRRTAAEHALFAPGVSRVALAVSGGADSVCLLHAMLQLRKEFDITLCAAHLNHGVRGAEADADQHFVQNLAEANGLAFYTETVDVPSMLKPGGPSLEQVCREQRMAFYGRALDQLGAQWIATGHTLSDQAETMLMRLVRGASLRGLAAMDYRSGNIIRPLLAAPRELVRDYVRQHSLEFREDATNADERFTRNRVRHTLMPLLEREFNPKAEHALFAVTQLLREDSGFLEEQAGIAYQNAVAESGGDAVHLDLKALSGLHDAILQRVLVMAYYTIAGDASVTLEQQHVRGMALAVKQGRTGMVLELPGYVSVERGYDHLAFMIKRKKAADACCESAINMERLRALLCGAERAHFTTHCKPLDVALEFSTTPAKMALIANNPDPRIAYFDADRIGELLLIRNPRRGDRFRPLGMDAEKKLQDFFVDEKVPRERRRSAPLLVCGDQIMWVVGRRIDDRFKVHANTKLALRVKCL